MKDLKEIAPGERKHFLRCPDCRQWFDMRDLGAVMAHQHWTATPLPPLSCSRAERLQRPGEETVPDGRTSRRPDTHG